MHRTEQNPKFRNRMFVLMAILVIGYIGIKIWHVNLAMTAFQGQVLDGDTSGAAK